MLAVAVVIDIRGVAAADVRVGASPLAELTAVLHVLSDPPHHPDRARWAAELTARLPVDLVEDLLGFAVLWQSARADFLLPGLPGLTLADDLDRIDALDDSTWISAALTSQRAAPSGRRPTPEILSEAWWTAALDGARARGPRTLEFAGKLLDDATGVRAKVREALLTCDRVFFAELWDGIRGTLTAAAITAREHLRRRGIAGLAMVSPAVSVDEPAGRVVVDKLSDVTAVATDGGLTLIPSVYGAPHLTVRFTPGWRPVLQYPVSLGPHTMPGDVLTADALRRQLEALAHPVRMRLCRTLARGAHTTGELAAYWGLSPPEVSRHLGVLRRAGLLRTQRRGRYVGYELNLTTCAQLGERFLETILR
jgi:DNA-binding transcriptional ArsR family regulator